MTMYFWVSCTSGTQPCPVGRATSEANISLEYKEVAEKCTVLSIMLTEGHKQGAERAENCQTFLFCLPICYPINSLIEQAPTFILCCSNWNSCR